MATQINISISDALMFSMIPIARKFGMTDKDIYGIGFTNSWINK